MFKLNHENYVKSLESVQELERVLLEEMDNQQEIEDSVRDIWVGRQMLSKAAECAGEYLNLSGIEDLISKGEKKIKRLENYQYEFDLFAQKMSDLESSMPTDLSTVMRETGMR